MTGLSDHPSWAEVRADGIALRVLAQPGASRTEATGVLDDRLKIRLAAPAVEGEANRELTAFLAKAFRLPKSSVEITQGRTGRRKTVFLPGVTVRQALSVFSFPAS